MTVEQVIKLLDNGYTKEDIQKMEHGTQPVQSPAAADPEPTPAAEQGTTQTEPAEHTEPAPAAPATSAEPSETEKRLGSLEESIGSLIKAIQSQNLKNDSFGSTAPDLETETDKIMASIIRPERKEKHD